MEFFAILFLTCIRSSIHNVFLKRLLCHGTQSVCNVSLYGVQLEHVVLCLGTSTVSISVALSKKRPLIRMKYTSFRGSAQLMFGHMLY